jgi:hypothetical protein
MGKIEKRFEPEKSLTVFTVLGAVSADEFSQAIEEFYEKGPVTNKVLFDLTDSFLDQLRSEEILNISRTPKYIPEQRVGGKTAIVAPSDLAFGLARMYEFSSDPADIPFVIKVFRTMEEARKWLEI